MSRSISFAGDATLPSALSLFLRGVPMPERLVLKGEVLDLAVRSQFSPQNYVLLIENNTPVEAIHFEVVTGDVGIVQLPYFLIGENVEKTSYLLREVIRSSPKLRFAYCLAEETAESDKTLHDAGFRRITTMETWSLELEHSRAQANLNPKGVTYPKSIRDCLSLLSEAQMSSTDLPELEGLREPEEVWRGFLQVAPTESSWFIHEIEGEAVALAIIDQKHLARWGLAFLGVKPAYRQKGFGSLVLSGILAKAKAKGVESIDLLVDSRNVDARRLYTARGFSARNSRPIYLWLPDR